MKVRKETKKRILKIIILLLITSIMFFACSSVSFAGDEGRPKSSGFVSVLLIAFRAIIAVVFISVTFLIGVLIGGQASALNVETFIFNRYKLTSLQIFTGSKVDPIGNTLFDNVAKWFMILFALAIFLELIVLLYIAINTIFKTLRQDPEKQAEVKKMAKDFVLGLVVLLGMGVFVIAIILINNTIVSALYRGMGFDKSFQTITGNLMLGIFKWDPVEGTLSLMLYIIIAVMGIIFFIYYLKRLLKVSFLVVISPMVAITYAIDKRTGGAKRLLAWTKMFAYTVFVQTVHALIYTAFISVVVQETFKSSTGLVASVIILVAGLKFLWDAENIIGELFGIAAEKVQGSAAVLLGFMTQAGKIKDTASKLSSKPPVKIIVTKDPPSSAKSKIKIKKGKLDKADVGDVKKKFKEKDNKQVNAKDEKRKSDSKTPTKPKERKSNYKDEVASSKYEKRPLKGLGTSAKEYAISKVRNLGPQTLRRIRNKSASWLVKGTVAGVAAVASHATPEVGMYASVLGGAKLAGWGMNKAQTTRHKIKYNGKSKAYKETLEEEAEQLKAIEQRRKKLEQAGTEEKQVDKKDQKDLDEKDKKDQKELDEKDKKDLNEKDEKDEKDKEDEKEAKEVTSKEIDDNEMERYVKDISNAPKEELENEYKAAKQASINYLQKEKGKSSSQARLHVDKLQRGLLKEKDFNYKTLEEVDRKLLQTYLDVITKQKMEDFESNTQNKIKYKEVLDKALESPK